MQTYDTLLAKVPIEIRDRILVNAGYKSEYTTDYLSVYELIACAFDWELTREGFHYWDQIMLHLISSDNLSSESFEKYRQDWELTDPDTLQFRRTITEDKVYEFKEARLINPETGEKEAFRATLNFDDYTWQQLVDACTPFGYDVRDLDRWIKSGDEIPLMLECVFELM